MNAIRPAGSSSSSVTGTITLEAPSSSNPQSQQLQQPQEALFLPLRRKKKVTWKEGTIDNEFMQKKSSKKCCIFHKQKPFDEDNSDDEEDNGDASHRCGKGVNHDEHGGCQHDDAGPSGSGLDQSNQD